jgi:hypothetical protein
MQPLMPTKTNVDVITTRELEDYLDAKGAADRANRRLARRREDLIMKVKLGIRVQHGPWIPQLTRTESRRFSAAALEAAVGRDEMERLRGQLPVQYAETFGLIPREGWDAD